MPLQLTPSFFSDVLPKRHPDAHKGQHGHVLVVAGHNEMLGAGYLSSLAAFRVGAGLVTYALPQTAFQSFDARFPEVIPVAIPDNGAKHFVAASAEKIISLAVGKQVLALGPGLGQAKATADCVCFLLEKIHLPLVLDADGLNLVAHQLDVLQKRQAPSIITPHPGEMARLLSIPAEEVQARRAELAANFARHNNCIVVLKGFGTLIAHPDGRLFHNPTGSSAMAVAGTGDVLTGCIAGLIAQGMPPWEASLAAVYCHGLAGELATKKLHADKGLLASDLLNFLPEALHHV